MADELLTAEQRADFLEALRQGIAPGMAARSVGFTGTKLRGCRKRDPVFAAEFDEAEAEGEEFYGERLRASARIKALAENGSDRIHIVELAAWGGPKYAHLRRDRVTVGGKVEHAIVLDPAALEGLPLEKLVALRQLLGELGGGAITDGEYDELPPGVISDGAE